MRNPLYRLRPYLLIYSSLIFLSVSTTYSQVPSEVKINGLSFVATNDTVEQQHVDPVKQLNANWVAVMPFGFMERTDSPKLFYDNERQWYGETSEGIEQCIDLMHQNDIQVMLKPQIWIGNGDFTGDIQMATEEDWCDYQQQYTAMMMLYARLAERSGAAMLCIGTEMNSFVMQRPDYWRELILKIRSVYSGKLTYAENWDKYDQVPFWKELDFIGVDAYFPISDERTPQIDELQASWQPICQALQVFSRSMDKQVLFTEFGYRSMDQAGKKPWDSSRINGKVNQQAQANLLQAIFNVFWKEDWFKGGFLWKWFPDADAYEERQKNRFSVQQKRAEAVVREFYQENS